MSKTLIVAGLIIVAVGSLFFMQNFNKTEDDILKSTNSLITDKPKNKDFSQWREFVSASGHFKVKLPILPQHISDKVTDSVTGEIRNYETFIAVSDTGEAFMISVITFPRDVEKEIDKESLKAVVTEMLERNKENKLNIMTDNLSHPSKALDFSITSGELLIKGMIFAKANTVYLLSMIDNNDLFNNKDLEYFFKSFDLVGEK